MIPEPRGMMGNGPICVKMYCWTAELNMKFKKSAQMSGLFVVLRMKKGSGKDTILGGPPPFGAVGAALEMGVKEYLKVVPTGCSELLLPTSR